MKKTGWHILRDEHAVTVARHLPARFDLRVEAMLTAPGPVSLTALAHQVRQDMWRALQRLRGFSPVVRVCRTDQGLQIEAGGRVPVVSGAATDRLVALLNDPIKRRRWLAHAGRQT